MATELAKAYVQIVPSAKGIKSKLSEVLGNEGGAAADEAGSTIGSSLASKIKNVIAAAGIGSAIKAALSEGADLQQSIGGIETLFKDSADKVVENAKNAYMTAGMSANEYMETVTSFSASLLQGLSGDTNKAAEVADMALTDMADNANKMGTSMESIQNAYQGFAKQNYTMLDNLKLGYGGTKTEMERLLKDAQKISGVKYDIGNLSDVYEAIHIIQEEMDITGTTAKEAASTFSGSLASMKAAASNVLANLALGENVDDSLYALIGTVHTFINDNLVPMIGNIISSIPTVVEYGMSLITRSLNIIGNNASDIVQNGVEFVGNLITGIVSHLPYLIEAALRLVAEFGNAIINTDWTQVATDTISALQENMGVAAEEILGTDGKLIDSLLNAITSQLPSVLDKGIEIVSNLANGILNSLPTMVTSAGELLDKFLKFIIQNLPQVLNAGVKLVLNLVDGIIASLPDVISSAISVIGNLLNTFLKNAPMLIESGLALIGELIAGIIKAVPDLLKKIPEIISDIKEKFESIDWGEVGKNILNGIAKGLSSGVNAIVDAAEEAAGKALDAAKDFLGIRSPSRVFENQVGKMIDLGLAAGVDNNVKYVADSMKELSNMTVGSIDTKILSEDGFSGSAGFENDVNSYERLGQYIVNAILEQGRMQAEAVKEGMSDIRMVPNERQFIRFINELGYAKG